MRADLHPAPEEAEAPSFLVAALKDPLSGNLDRIQIVKGWVDAAGEMRGSARTRRIVVMLSPLTMHLRMRTLSRSSFCAW
jgi:hypothetical protein